MGTYWPLLSQNAHKRCPKPLPESAAIPEDGVTHTERRLPKPPAVPKAAPPVGVAPFPIPPVMPPIGVEDPKDGCPNVEPPLWEVVDVLVGAPNGDSDLPIAAKPEAGELVEPNVEVAGLLNALPKPLWLKVGTAWAPALTSGEACRSACGRCCA